jgi:hypothetical protein
MNKYLFNVQTTIEVIAPDEATAFDILYGNHMWPVGDFHICSDVLGDVSKETLDSDALLVEVEAIPGVEPVPCCVCGTSHPNRQHGSVVGY